MTLNKGQGHPNWYRNVKLSGLYYHTKFERNRSVNVWLHTNIEVFCCFFFVVFFSLTKSHSTVFSPEYQTAEIKWVWDSSHQQVSSIPNSIQIDQKICEIPGAEVVAFSHSCDLESRLWSIRLVSKCRVQQYLLSHLVWIKLICKNLNACQG